jgi:hypothetical protein
MNLEFVNHYAPKWDPKDLRSSDQPPFRDTQLVISLLGILIFPHECAEKALGDLLDGYEGSFDEVLQVRYSTEANGRVILMAPEGRSETVDARSLKELPRLLRNSIAHFNIRPLDVHGDGRFSGVRIWNRNRKDQIDFVADLDFDAFLPLAYHILHSLHDREGLQLDDRPDPLIELKKQGKA